MPKHTGTIRKSGLRSGNQDCTRDATDSDKLQLVGSYRVSFGQERRFWQDELGGSEEGEAGVVDGEVCVSLRFECAGEAQSSVGEPEIGRVGYAGPFFVGFLPYGDV